MRRTDTKNSVIQGDDGANSNTAQLMDYFCKDVKEIGHLADCLVFYMSL